MLHPRELVRIYTCWNPVSRVAHKFCNAEFTSNSLWTLRRPRARVYVPGLRRVVDSTVFSQPGLTLEPDPRPNPCQEEGSIFGSGMLPKLFLFPTKQSCTYLPTLELLNKTVFNYSWSSFSSLLIQNPSWLINWRLIQQIHNKSEKRNILNFPVLLKTLKSKTIFN